jgi:hypothetical protein
MTTLRTTAKGFCHDCGVVSTLVTTKPELGFLRSFVFMPCAFCLGVSKALTYETLKGNFVYIKFDAASDMQEQLVGKLYKKEENPHLLDSFSFTSDNPFTFSEIQLDY